MYIKYNNLFYSNDLFLYQDYELDISFIKIKSHSRINSCQLLHEDIQDYTSDEVFIVNNNGEISQGSITNFQYVLGVFPTQVILSNLRTNYGDSGSPIFNKDSHVIGINFASNGVVNAIIPYFYINYFLQYIKLSLPPPKMNFGILFSYCNDMDYSSFCITKFIKFPEALYQNNLSIGDELLSIEGEKISNLFSLQKVIWESTHEKTFLFQKEEKLFSISLSPFPIDSYDKVQKLLIGDIKISFADVFINVKSDISIGRLIYQDELHQNSYLEIIDINGHNLIDKEGDLIEFFYNEICSSADKTIFSTLEVCSYLGNNTICESKILDFTFLQMNQCFLEA
ncbi:MAG: hypothetical protein ACI8ZF_000915 [Candidatus Midichloriaceae bacterium]